jgi:hypothetical protein
MESNHVGYIKCLGYYQKITGIPIIWPAIHFHRKYRPFMKKDARKNMKEVVH